ncbi:MAG: hypothetical protein KJ867_10550, partial [Gammaproteobacteria bacterium]|nr:hypothetical protein [Gammaproteobacteria bacterium]
MIQKIDARWRGKNRVIRGSCKTARTSCGSGINRHFQWPKPLKMKKTENRIFVFALQNGQDGHFASSSIKSESSLPGSAVFGYSCNT